MAARLGRRESFEGVRGRSLLWGPEAPSPSAVFCSIFVPFAERLEQNPRSGVFVYAGNSRHGQHVPYFQSKCSFPSWTSRVRVPSPAPFSTAYKPSRNPFIQIPSIRASLARPRPPDGSPLPVSACATPACSGSGSHPRYVPSDWRELLSRCPTRCSTWSEFSA